jgi:hypothetical protein
VAEGELLGHEEVEKMPGLHFGWTRSLAIAVILIFYTYAQGHRGTRGCSRSSSPG